MTDFDFTVISSYSLKKKYMSEVAPLKVGQLWTYTCSCIVLNSMEECSNSNSMNDIMKVTSLETLFISVNKNSKKVGVMFILLD